MTNDDVMFQKQKENEFLSNEIKQYAFQLGFDEGVKWMIEKSYKWLKQNCNIKDKKVKLFYINSFKKAMKE